jgi:general secretion pathway protein G
MIELMFAVAILGALVAIALPSYQNYREKARIHEAVTEMAAISMNLKNYQLDNKYFPPTLNTLPMYNPVPNDPWGRPYQYLAIDIDPAPNKGAVRKDKNMNPLNSDFDRYSMGPDGQTSLPLTAAKAKDDIVRADNGRFIGVAQDH